MDIVLGLLMAYVLGGAVWPQMVRNRPFFLLGALAVVAAIVLSAFELWWPFHLITRLEEAFTFVLLILAAGGGSPGQLWRDLGGSWRRPQ